MLCKLKRGAIGLICATVTCCSLYNEELINRAQGGDGDTTAGNHRASGGTIGNGSGGKPSSDGAATGGRMGGAGGLDNDPASGGRASGGETNGSDCPQGDCCPDDPKKTEAGQCGCGEPDDDTDGDLTADCIDLCPDEPSKTEPGDCGCQVPASDEAKCSAIKNGIAHRFEFEGTGTEAADSVGAEHGAILGGGLQKNGVLSLNGSAQYVALPPGLISSLTNASFEVWFTWTGENAYERIFDFGDTTGSPAQGLSYLFLTVNRGNEQPGSGFSLAGNMVEVGTKTTEPISTGVQYHIVLVANDDEGVFNLYLDGAFQSSVAFVSSLSDINDVNGYLGRSQFEVDSYFHGEIAEFRVYDVALSSSQIAYSRTLGPDTKLF